MASFRVLGPVLVGVVSLTTACSHKPKPVSKDTLTTTYHHSYGAELANQSEWVERGASGEIVRHETNGIEIREQYVAGVLHGRTSWSFPHSNRIARVALYKNGELTEETFHFTSGAPREKRSYATNGKNVLTAWYESGSPRCVEEYMGTKLVKGEYFTPKNELEKLLVNSTGVRPQRDAKGVLMVEETFAQGELVERKSFYSSGAVKAVAPIAQGRVHGVLKSYFENGEPDALEEWNEGELHGKVTLFSNGERVATVPYVHGRKEGVELRYQAGTDTVAEEISWAADRRHGPTTCYSGSISRTEWYLCGDKVSASDMR